jgi:DNA-binding MarR family transcriptional regulator
MHPVHDERPLAAWVALVQAHGVVLEGVERRLVAEAGLPVSWYEVLVRLSRADEERMRMQDLARSVLLSKSGLTRLADRMEAAGLVERRACATDRRVTYVALTDRGREALERAQPVFASGVEHHLAYHLPAEDLDRLTGALQRVIRGNGEAVDDCVEPAATPVAAAARSS